MRADNYCMSQLTDTRLDVDPLPGEEVLEVLHPQLHQLAAVGRPLVEHAAPRARALAGPGAALARETGRAEDVAALRAGALAGDEGELGGAHVAVQRGGGGGGRLAGRVRGAVVVRGATPHSAGPRLEIEKIISKRKSSLFHDHVNTLHAGTVMI